jgi:hypothetical protein
LHFPTPPPLLEDLLQTATIVGVHLMVSPVEQPPPFDDPAMLFHLPGHTISLRFVDSDNHCSLIDVFGSVFYLNNHLLCCQEFQFN